MPASNDVKEFLSENGHLYLTAKQIFPEMDEETWSLEELLINIKILSDHFGEQLMKEANKRQMVEDLEQFVCTHPDIVSEKLGICWLEIPFFLVMSANLKLLRLCTQAWNNMKMFRLYDGRTLLHYAIKQKVFDMDTIRLLLGCIDPNIPSKHFTPLIDLLWSPILTNEHKKEILDLFLDAGAKLGKQVSLMKITPLSAYVSHLHRTILEDAQLALGDSDWMKIIDRIAITDINVKSEFGMTPLHWIIHFAPSQLTPVDSDFKYDSVIERKFFELMDYIVSKGASLDVCNNVGMSILHSAVACCNVNVVKYAIEHGCPVTCTDRLGLNAVYYACVKVNLDEKRFQQYLLPMLEAILNSGADINTPAANGTTVLHHAAATGVVMLNKYLISRGANVSALDYLSRTPLHFSIMNKDPCIVNALVQAGAALDTQDKYGYTALHYACLQGNRRVQKALLQCGANVNIKSSSACQYVQPLHLATSYPKVFTELSANLCGHEGPVNYPDLVTNLIEVGADVNCTDASGATPLHYAGFSGWPNQVKVLVEHGGDMNTTDALNQTPLSIALEQGDIHVAKLLTHDPKEIKFGELTFFPSHEGIKQEDVCSYFMSLTKELQAIGSPRVICNSILSTPALCRVDFFKGESKEIKQKITSLASDIVQKIGELDQRFRGQMSFSGSALDGIKVGFPDEFDFHVRLEFFENCIAEIMPLSSGFAKLKVKNEMLAELGEFLMEEEYLNSYSVYLEFRRLLLIAWFDVHKCGHEDLFTGPIRMDQTNRLFVSQPVPYWDIQLLDISLIWIGSKYKGLNISVDINPVVVCQHWPPEAISFSHLHPHITTEPMYLFPRPQPDKMNISPLCSKVHWGFSFIKAESGMFDSFPAVLKDAFVLCKAFRMPPFVPAVHEIPSLDTLEEMPLLKRDINDVREIPHSNTCDAKPLLGKNVPEIRGIPPSHTLGDIPLLEGDVPDIRKIPLSQSLDDIPLLEEDVPDMQEIPQSDTLDTPLLEGDVHNVIEIPPADTLDELHVLKGEQILYKRCNSSEETKKKKVPTATLR